MVVAKISFSFENEQGDSFSKVYETAIPESINPFSDKYFSPRTSVVLLRKMVMKAFKEEEEARVSEKQSRLLTHDLTILTSILARYEVEGTLCIPVKDLRSEVIERGLTANRFERLIEACVHAGTVHDNGDSIILLGKVNNDTK